VKKLKRKTITSVCVGFLLLYFLSMWGLTEWKMDDLSESMNDHFNDVHTTLWVQSAEDDFAERVEEHLTDLSAKLSLRNIYAVAVYLDARGEVLARSNADDFYFGERGAAANRLNPERYDACFRDACNGINISENFSFGRAGSGMSATGPFGHTQCWSIGNDDDNLHYISINAKFFEREFAVRSMIEMYVLAFVFLAAFCLLLCLVIAHFFSMSETPFNR